MLIRSSAHPLIRSSAHPLIRFRAVSAFSAVLPISLLSFLQGCSKEATNTPNPAAIDLAALEEKYQPSQEEATIRIHEFSARRRAFDQGQKAGGGDIPVGEALWLSEADLNFELADASVILDDWEVDSFFTTTPVQTDGQGNYVIPESHLLIAQATLQEHFEGLDRIQFVDVNLKDLSPDGAIFRALAYRRVGSAGGPGSLAPLPTGCFAIQVADDIMNQYMARLNAEPVGTFYVSISSQVQGLTPMNSTGGILNGYTTYLGSDASFGLVEYLASGAVSSQFCFPDYWQKHLDLKQWYFSQYQPQPGHRMIHEVYYDYYAPRTGSPMSYGSPYYPMGPYDHIYEFRRALAICCANDPGNGQ